MSCAPIYASSHALPLKRSRSNTWQRQEKINIVILLSMLLNRYQADGKQKLLNVLKKISPVAWQHIHFLGHYLFRGPKRPIDLEAVLAHADLD
jgi:hypothetical protein